MTSWPQPSQAVVHTSAHAALPKLRSTVMPRLDVTSLHPASDPESTDDSESATLSSCSDSSDSSSEVEDNEIVVRPSTVSSSAARTAPAHTVEFATGSVDHPSPSLSASASVTTFKRSLLRESFLCTDEDSDEERDTTPTRTPHSSSPLLASNAAKKSLLRMPASSTSPSITVECESEAAAVSPQPVQSERRAAARLSLFSAIRRGLITEVATSTTGPSGAQTLPTPMPGMSARRREQRTTQRRLPSLDQISSRVNAGGHLGVGTPSLKREFDGSVPSTPHSAQPRTASCPTMSTPQQHRFGEVDVFVTPPTPRPVSGPGSDAEMEQITMAAREQMRSPSLAPPRSPFSAPTDLETDHLTPPPFELAPGKTRMMAERAAGMMALVQARMQALQAASSGSDSATGTLPNAWLHLQQQHLMQQALGHSGSLTAEPGSPIPPQATQALARAAAQARFPSRRAGGSYGPSNASAPQATKTPQADQSSDWRSPHRSNATLTPTPAPASQGKYVPPARRSGGALPPPVDVQNSARTSRHRGRSTRTVNTALPLAVPMSVGQARGRSVGR